MKNIRKFGSVAEYNSALNSIKELDSYLALTIGADGVLEYPDGVSMRQNINPQAISVLTYIDI